MRMAIISDIHSNFQALQAVLGDIERQAVDQVVVVGDAINCGPSPREVLDTLYQKQWPMVLGNHEQYVQETRLPQDQWDYPPEWGTSHWTAQYITPADFAFLDALPWTMELGDVFLTHASPTNLFGGIYPFTTSAELEQAFGHVAQNIIVTAHTHLPFVIHWGQKLVVNAGSVGMPLDGINTASYAIITQLNERILVQHRRVPYDIATVEKLMVERDLLQASPFASAFLRQMQTGYPHVDNLIKQVFDLRNSHQLSLVEALYQVDVASMEPFMKSGVIQQHHRVE